jgi:hypothetical protein
LEYNGKILFENYSDPFKLRELMDLGDLSSLRITIGTKHKFSSFDLATRIEQLAHEETTKDMCTFYARDRGEELRVRMYKDFEDYTQNHQYEEYEYILRKDGNWYVKQHDNEYELLAPALVKALAEETA